jgi:ankyrin repeat protein
MSNIELTASEGAAESPLHEAAWRGDVGEVRRLVEAGADVNWRDSVGETALFGACAWGRLEVVRYLLEVGARHDLRESFSGLTPLHWAASHGNIDTIRALLEAGSDPTIEDKFGRLPVDLAHEHGKGQHVALLKKVGPPIASRRRRGGA